MNSISKKPLYRAFSNFAEIKVAPKDAIFGLHEKFIKDGDAKKVDLTLGSYKDKSGDSYIFPSVSEAENHIHSEKLKMDYLPIEGNKEFVSAAINLLFGRENTVLLENRVAAIQSLSGTGALRLAFEFIHKQLAPRPVYISTPTYANHVPLLQSAGLSDIREYRYYDTEKNSLDFEGMLDDLKNAPDNSVVLLQAVAHNPTGTDPTSSQWKTLSSLCKKKQFICVIDFAYQGFASGDPDKDALAPRTFASDNNTLFVCQSFAKNFGLYGHRIGCLSALTSSAEEKNCLVSQFKRLVRTSYSNPPLHGARIVAKILNDAGLSNQWRTELRDVVARMRQMRKRLQEELLIRGATSDWRHIEKQIGMFCFSGLTSSQTRFLHREWHVYVTEDGRLSVPGLTEENVAYVAEAIHAVSR